MSVSVLLPAFNAEKYISDTIKSILSQSYRDFELIIINDGSTDLTPIIIKDYGSLDDRIIIIGQSNKGMAAALNYGLEIAKYSLIARIDADDLMHPYRLQKQVEYMRNNPDVAIVGSYIYYINEKGIVVGKGKTDFLSSDTIRSKINNNYIIGFNHPTVMMRKNVILDIGGYRGEYWPADDIDLWNRVVEKGFRIDIIPEYLTYYRIHANSVSINSVRNSILKSKWVKYNVIRRRSGCNEVTYEEFIENFNKKNVIKKLDSKRKLFGQILYKKAVFYFSNKKLLSFIYNLLLALIINPNYTIKKSIKKF